MDGLFEIVTHVGNIILFSVAASFMVLEVVDMVLGIYESIKARNLAKGRQEVKQEMREWIKQEREKGIDIPDPPFLKKDNETS